jgi:predicted transcriptional regulator
MTTKEKILQALEGLPDDANLNDAILDAIDRLLLLYKIEYALAEAEAGNTVSHEEAMKRMQRWLE